MKKQNRIIGLFLGFLAVFSLLPSPSVFAAQGQIGFILSPSSQTVTNGDSFAVKFTLDISQRYSGVIGINGKIVFPKNILNVASVDTSASNYMNFSSTTFDNNAGTITFNRANYFPTEQSTYVFTINFKAVGVGTATAVFDNTTSGQNNPPSYVVNGTYVSKAPTCPSGQVGTPPNCTTPAPTPVTPKPTPAPTPTPAPAAPTPTPVVIPTITPTATPPADAAPVQIDAGDLSIQKVAATNTRQLNRLEWTAAGQNVVSSLQIGTTKTALRDGPSVTPKDNGGFQTDFTDLQPGTRYYYTLTAYQSNTPDKKATYSGAFTTRGYPVVVTVTKNGGPLINAKVKIDQSTYTTDKDGTVRLELANKSYDVAITAASGETKTEAIKVAKKTTPTNGSDPETQKFTFDITSQATTGTSQNSQFPLATIASIVGGIIAIAGSGFGFLLYKRRKAEQLAYPIASVDEQGWSPEPQQEMMQPYNPNQAVAAVEQTYIPEADTATYPLAAGSVLKDDGGELDTNESYVSTDMVGQDTATQSPDDYQSAGAGPYLQNYPLTEQQYVSNYTDVDETTSTQYVAEETTQPETIEPQDNATPESHEPEAIYDPSTGELDIVHHQPHSTPARGIL